MSGHSIDVNSSYLKLKLKLFNVAKDNWVVVFFANNLVIRQRGNDESITFKRRGSIKLFNGAGIC